MEQKEIFDVTSSYLSEELTHGCPDPETQELQKTFVVQELSGDEEDLMGGGGRVGIHQRYNQLIFNCLVSIGSINDRKNLFKAVSNMTALDRLVVLIAIRRATYEDNYRMQANLPSDAGEKSPKWYTIDLKKDLHHKESNTGGKLSFTEVITIKRGDVTRECPVSWHVMRGKDEEWLAKVEDQVADVSSLTLKLLVRITSIAGRDIKCPSPDLPKKELQSEIDEVVKFLRKIPAPVRNSIRHRFDKVEGDLDLMMDFTYKDKDGDEQEFRIPLDPSQPGFFFPPET